MNETADIASSIPTIILLSIWWAFIAMLELLSSQDPTGRQKPDANGGKHNFVNCQDFPELGEANPEFSAEIFMAGARKAYEEILLAYSQGDLKALRPLLSADVYQVFADTCVQRKSTGGTLELALIGIQVSEIVHIEVSCETTEVDVRFRAQIVSVERSDTGKVIDGDPGNIKTTCDLWTFSRSGRNEWIVAATDVG